MGSRLKSSLCLCAILVCAYLVPSEAFANCDAQALGPTSYIEAENFVYTLPEVKTWRELINTVPGKKVITMPSVDSQLLIDGRCYWSVTLYSDEGPYTHRWNTFYVRLKDKHILVDDFTGGDPVSLKQWRANILSESDSK